MTERTDRAEAAFVDDLLFALAGVVVLSGRVQQAIVKLADDDGNEVGLDVVPDRQFVELLLGAWSLAEQLAGWGDPTPTSDRPHEANEVGVELRELLR